jgi:AraC-like DNA-binding protein
VRDFEIEKALAFIDAHIEEKLFLNDIADNLGYSPFYVSRIFSQIMGISIVSYVRMRKLQFAFSSLQKSKTIVEVAYQYGFESHEGFSRSFKRFFGFSPKVIKDQKVDYVIPNYFVINERRIENMNSKKYIEEMHMMLFLLLKESIIEMQEGHCSKICISILPNNYVEIIDDGSGIPLVDEVQKSSKILNRIFGGHPISSLDYANIEDFNNLELNMVNSLCENMSICVWRNGKSYSQDYINGVAQHELIIEDSSHPNGMKVTLKPNSNIFGNVLWSKEMIEDFIVKNASNYVESIFVENANF